MCGEICFGCGRCNGKNRFVKPAGTCLACGAQNDPSQSACSACGAALITPPGVASKSTPSTSASR